MSTRLPAGTGTDAMAPAAPGLHGVVADAVPPQPWRNGGGRTRELLAWPSAADWRCRISRADIEADGPFSAFPGIERWFTVLAGAGVRLALPDGARVLRAGDAPLRFDGADAPGCQLLDGPTLDLNLMVRGGHGAMQAVRPGAAWTDGAPLRALYTTRAGRWQGPGGTQDLPAHSLLWSAQAAGEAWRFTPAAAGGAWWMACHVDGAPA